MDWKNEAISNYVVFFLGILFGIIGFLITRWLGRRQRRRVIVTKVDESSLIEVDPQVRGKIAVTYNGVSVDSLYLTTFSLWNAGSDIVDDVEISIALSDTDIIEVFVDDPLARRKSTMNVSRSDDCMTLRLDYLNPKKIDDDSIRIRVFAAEPINVRRVSGGGRGWSAEFVDRVSLIADINEELSIVGVGESIAEMSFLALRAFFRILPKVRKVVNTHGKGDMD